MNSRFPVLASFAAVLALTLTNCSGPSSTPAVRYYFDTSNLGPCNPLTVFLDLDAAGAVLAKLQDGSPDCGASASLAARNCPMEFEEAPDGSALVVTIDCATEVDALFDCAFEQADAMALNASVDAHCVCTVQPVCELNDTCYYSPGICISENPSPGTCEDCYNGIDDDGDGKKDCRDGDCWLDCGVGQTTVTCTSSSTTTTTTTTTTSSTTTTTLIIVDPKSYDVVFRMVSSDVGLGALQITVDYSATGGEFSGSGASVACVSLAPGALFAPNDVDASSRLTLGHIALAPIPAPNDLAKCVFLSGPNPPLPGEFVVTVDDATDTDGAPANPVIEVLVTETL